MRAGLRAVRPRLNLDNLPLTEDQIPDIMKLKKLNPLFFEDTYLTDESISKITFQVINIGHYHKNESRLLGDIKRFDPHMLALAWCFSINGDVSMVLRNEGVFA